MSAWKTAGRKLAAILKALLVIVLFFCANYLVYFVFAGLKLDISLYKGTFNFVANLATFVVIFIFHRCNSSKDSPLIKVKRLYPNQVIALVFISIGMLGMVTTYIGIANRIAENMESMKNAMEEYTESVDRYSDTQQAVVPVWDSVL